MQSSTSSSFTASGSWAQQPQQPMLDAFQQPRQTYQSGYLMSSLQGNPMPANGQRFDNPAPLPTKSKSHHLLARSSSSDYGSDSLFDRSHARQSMMDEDAPPVNSVADMISKAQPDQSTSKRGLASPAQAQKLGTPTRSPPPITPQVRYVLVFGFPPEHAGQMATMFAASADTTQPEHEGGNWFRIGYRNHWDYERALRRNGEIVNNSFMIGVLPADGDADPHTPGAPRGLIAHTPSTPGTSGGIGRSQTFSSFGKPLTLAPSAAAYKPAAPASAPQRSSVVIDNKNDAGWGSKISDMIFGW
ncbi:hypothetical protein AURDEDRAFT_113210, partial [Auricularia subglabra TFB-10046 SS5]